ncbi:hypothetical protein LINPERHAP2_LOCUS25878 [Linum perenne]
MKWVAAALGLESKIKHLKMHWQLTQRMNQIDGRRLLQTWRGRHWKRLKSTLIYCLRILVLLNLVVFPYLAIILPPSLRLAMVATKVLVRRVAMEGIKTVSPIRGIRVQGQIRNAARELLGQKMNIGFAAQLFLYSIFTSVIPSWIGKIWERRLEKYIQEFCGDEDTHPGGKPCSEVFHPVELDEQGPEAIQHS